MNAFWCSFNAAGANLSLELINPNATNRGSQYSISQLNWRGVGGKNVTLSALFAQCPYILYNTYREHDVDIHNETLCGGINDIIRFDPHPTHLILGIGHWYKKPAEAATGIITALRSLERFYLAHPHIPPPHFVWRGVFPRHYFDHEWTSNSSGCDRFTSPSFDIPLRKFKDEAWPLEMDKITLQALADLTRVSPIWKNVNFLDVNYILQHRADAHSGGRDCTHYCPSVAMPVVVQWLLKILLGDS